MEPPPGLEVLDGMVLKLVKAVYGTKQGGRLWYEKIRDKLKSMGYTRTESDQEVNGDARGKKKTGWGMKQRREVI